MISEKYEEDKLKRNRTINRKLMKVVHFISLKKWAVRDI